MHEPCEWNGNFDVVVLGSRASAETAEEVKVDAQCSGAQTQGILVTEEEVGRSHQTGVTSKASQNSGAGSWLLGLSVRTDLRPIHKAVQCHPWDEDATTDTDRGDLTPPDRLVGEGPADAK